VNERQLLRQQLQTERAHASAVANACAAALTGAAGAGAGNALEPFLRACVDYLVSVLAWFEERDQRLAELAAAVPVSATTRNTLQATLAGPGSSRESLARLEAACERSRALAEAATPAAAGTAREAWRQFAQYFNGPWSARRDALTALVEGLPGVSAWRAVAGIDADTILEERHRYAQVCERLPPGITLAPAPAHGPVP
jgi:hypothetical protein